MVDLEPPKKKRPRSEHSKAVKNARQRAYRKDNESYAKRNKEACKRYRQKKKAEFPKTKGSENETS